MWWGKKISRSTYKHNYWLTDLHLRNCQKFLMVDIFCHFSSQLRNRLNSVAASPRWVFARALAQAVVPEAGLFAFLHEGAASFWRDIVARWLHQFCCLFPTAHFGVCVPEAFCRELRWSYIRPVCAGKRKFNFSTLRGERRIFLKLFNQIGRDKEFFWEVDNAEGVCVILNNNCAYPIFKFDRNRKKRFRINQTSIARSRGRERKKSIYQ